MAGHKPTGPRIKKQRIIELAAQGYKQVTIASMVGCRIKYVNACLSAVQQKSRRIAADAYYAKVDAGPNRHKRWTDLEDQLVLTSTESDVELAQKLGRTIRAVHLRRYRLRHG